MNNNLQDNLIQDNENLMNIENIEKIENIENVEKVQNVIDKIIINQFSIDKITDEITDLITDLITLPPSTTSTLTKREKTANFILDFLISNQNVYQFIKNPKTTSVPDIISFVYSVIGLLLIGVSVTGVSLLTFKMTKSHILKMYNKILNYAISISLEKYKTLKTKQYYHLEQKIKKDFEKKAAESMASKTTSWVNKSTSMMGSITGNIIGKGALKVLSVLGSTGTSLTIPIIPFISTLELRPGNLLFAMINTTIFNYLQKLTQLIAKWYNKYIDSKYVTDKIKEIIDDLFYSYYKLIEKHLKSKNSEEYKEKIQEINLLTTKILMLREYNKLPIENIKLYNSILQLTPKNKIDIEHALILLIDKKIDFYNLKNIHKLNSDNVSSVNSWNDFDINVLKSIILFTQHLVQLKKDRQQVDQIFKSHTNNYINPWIFKATPRNELENVIKNFEENNKSFKSLKDNWGNKYLWQQLCGQMRIVVSNTNSLVTSNIYIPKTMSDALYNKKQRYSHKSLENSYLFLSVETSQEFYDTLYFLWDKNGLLIYMYENLMKLRKLERLCFKDMCTFIKTFHLTSNNDIQYSDEVLRKKDIIINEIILISCSLLKAYKKLLSFYKSGDNFISQSFNSTLELFKQVFDISEDYCEYRSFDFYDYETMINKIKIECPSRIDKVIPYIRPNNHINELLL